MYDCMSNSHKYNYKSETENLACIYVFTSVLDDAEKLYILLTGVMQHSVKIGQWNDLRTRIVENKL